MATADASLVSKPLEAHAVENFLEADDIQQNMVDGSSIPAG